VKRAIAIGFFALAGCAGGTEVVARETLATSANVVETVDQSNAAAMRATYQADLAAATTRAEFEGKRAPYYRVTQAILAARELLFTAEASLDAAGAEAFVPAAACAARALGRIRRALDELAELVGAEVPIPPAIDAAISMLVSFGGACDVPAPAGEDPQRED
jgi:hypothetical protein